MAHYQNVVTFDPETPQSLHTHTQMVLILSGGGEEVLTYLVKSPGIQVP